MRNGAWSELGQILIGSVLPVSFLVLMAVNPQWSTEPSTKALVVGAALFAAMVFVVIRQHHPVLVGSIETILATWSLWLVISDGATPQFGLRLAAILGATYVMTRGLLPLYLHIKAKNDATHEASLVTHYVACPSCGVSRGTKCELPYDEFKVARFERSGVHNSRLYAYRMHDATVPAAAKVKGT